MHTKKSAIVRIEAAIIVIVVVVAAVAGIVVYTRVLRRRFAPKPSPAPPTPTPTPTPSPTPTKPETPTPVPLGVARVRDLSIVVSEVDRQENTTTLYFAITKVADTDSEGGKLMVTLTDDHGNQYLATLNVSLGGAPLGVIPLLPVGFTYVDSVNINMPKIAPIETIRFGEGPEIGFKDLQLIEPTFKQDFGEMTVEPGAGVPLGKYLTLTLSGPTGGVIGWTLPITVTSTEYNPFTVDIRLGLQFPDGRVTWSEAGSKTTQVPGSGKAVLEPQIITISQGISWGCPRVILISYGSAARRALGLMPLTAVQLPPIPERITFSGGQYDPYIYVMNADGSGKTKLSRGFISCPAWSPNGTKIAFNDGYELYVMNADGLAKTKIFEGKYFGAYLHSPAWSPDGTKMAFHYVSTIYVINADGSGERELTGGENPKWSPDGTKIVFERGDSVYVINADGSGERELAKGREPAWSPDGTKIAFSRDGYIYVMSVDSFKQTKLAKGFWPAWSPNGSKIAFSIGTPDRDSYICLMNADGSGETKLTKGQYPSWAPAFNLVEGGIKPPPPPDETKKDFIISDKEYRDYQSMSLIQIQRFLEDHNSFLASYRTQEVDGVERSAAEIIFNTAQKYHINPQVIIVTLQKEQSLITAPPGKEKESQLRKAMGYENPDYYGFANQIDAGTWQLDKYYQDIETKGTTVSGWGVGTTKTTQDGVYVTPENIATACLYSYTPWAGYQWGGNRSDVGGNYLFWYFYDKFGFYELTP